MLLQAPSAALDLPVLSRHAWYLLAVRWGRLDQRQWRQLLQELPELVQQLLKTTSALLAACSACLLLEKTQLQIASAALLAACHTCPRLQLAKIRSQMEHAVQGQLLQKLRKAWAAMPVVHHGQDQPMELPLARSFCVRASLKMVLEPACSESM